MEPNQAVLGSGGGKEQELPRPIDHGGYRIRFVTAPRKKSEGKSPGRGKRGGGTSRGRGRGRGKKTLVAGTLDDEYDSILDQAMSHFEKRIEEDNDYIQQVEMDDMDTIVSMLDSSEQKIPNGYQDYIKRLLGQKEDDVKTAATGNCVFIPKPRRTVPQVPKFDPSDLDFISRNLDVVSLREKLNAVYMLPHSNRCDCGREAYDDDETDFEDDFEVDTVIPEKVEKQKGVQLPSALISAINNTSPPPKKRFEFKKASATIKNDEAISTPLPEPQQANTDESENDSPDFLPPSPELKRFSRPGVATPYILQKSNSSADRLVLTPVSKKAPMLNITNSKELEAKSKEKSSDCLPLTRDVSTLSTTASQPGSSSRCESPVLPRTPESKKASSKSVTGSESPDFYPRTPEPEKKPTPAPVKKFNFRKKTTINAAVPLEELLNLAFTSEAPQCSPFPSQFTGEPCAHEPSQDSREVSFTMQAPLASVAIHRNAVDSHADSFAPLNSGIPQSSQTMRGEFSAPSSTAFGSQKSFPHSGSEDDDDFFVPPRPAMPVKRQLAKRKLPTPCSSSTSLPWQKHFLDDEDDDFVVPSTNRRKPLKPLSSSPIIHPSPDSMHSAEKAKPSREKKGKKKGPQQGGKSFVLEEVEVVGDDSGSETECSDLDKLDSSFVDTEEDSPTLTQQVRYVQSTNKTPDRMFKRREPLDQIAMAVIESGDAGDYDESDTFCVPNDYVEYAEAGDFTQKMDEARIAVLQESPTSRFKKNTRSKTRLQSSTFKEPGNKPRRKRIIQISSSSDSE